MAFPSILGCHRCSQTELFNSVRQCCFRPRLRGWKHLHCYCMLARFTALYEQWGHSAAPLLLLSLYEIYIPSKKKKTLQKLWFILPLTSHFVVHHIRKKTLPMCRCRNRARSLSLLCDAFETTLLSSSSFYTAAPLWWILIWRAGWFWQSVNLSSLRWLINNRKRDGLWC